MAAVVVRGSKFMFGSSEWIAQWAGEERRMQLRETRETRETVLRPWIRAGIYPPSPPATKPPWGNPAACALKHLWLLLPMRIPPITDSG